MAQLKDTSIDGTLTLNNGGGGNFKNIIDLLFPIGEIKFLDSATDPNELYPGTTWELIQGKFLVGYDEDDQDFNTINKIGGEKTVKLTKNQIPKMFWHTDNLNDSIKTLFSPGNTYGMNTSPDGQTATEGHNNLPPYQVVYIWKRTA